MIFEGHEVKDVGELMLASFPVDPNFSSTVSPNTWYSFYNYNINTINNHFSN